MGTNVAAGEKLQLLVGSNVWKKSKLLDEDISRARACLSFTLRAPLVADEKDTRGRCRG